MSEPEDPATVIVSGAPAKAAPNGQTDRAPTVISTPRGVSAPTPEVDSPASQPDEQPTVLLRHAPEKPTPPEFIGAVLNGIYQVTRFIARGGMGEVYEGAAVNNERDRVAIKIIRREFASDPNVQRMFRQEADMLMRLSHPGLVPYRVFARDSNLDVFYIVTQFVDGPTLSAALSTLGADANGLRTLTVRLAAALDAAHQLGCFHRDMCPDNVLLPNGRLEEAKIIDFGIAKKTAEGGETLFTTKGTFVGRFGYSAPEQFSELEIGPWTDVYSLALTMLAVAAGRPPDMGRNFWEAVKHRQTVPDLTPLPAELRPAFARMLAPDPAQRLRSMEEVVAQLRSTEKTPAAVRRTAATGGPKTATARRSWSSLPAIAGVTALLVAATAAVYLWPGGSLKPPPPSKAVQSASVTAAKPVLQPPAAAAPALAPPQNGSAKPVCDPKEEGAWEFVRNTTQGAPLQEFLRSYPKGCHEAQAREMLASLAASPARPPTQKVEEKSALLTPAPAPARSPAAPRCDSAEQSAWNLLGRSTDSARLSDFLKTYPNGCYSKEARERLASQSPEMPLQEIMRRADAAFDAKDYVQAMQLYRKAADQGNTTAELRVGFLYNMGFGATKDLAQAMLWYRKAADQGNARAQYNVGLFYQNGWSVDEDYVQAMQWYRKAADQGDARAQANVGTLYDSGLGVARDYQQALQWYRKAADQGDARAQDNIGMLYENGLGVPRDVNQARHWYDLAAKQGYSPARAHLAALGDI